MVVTECCCRCGRIQFGKRAVARASRRSGAGVALLSCPNPWRKPKDLAMEVTGVVLLRLSSSCCWLAVQAKVENSVDWPHRGRAARHAGAAWSGAEWARVAPLAQRGVAAAHVDHALGLLIAVSIPFHSDILASSSNGQRRLAALLAPTIFCATNILFAKVKMGSTKLAHLASLEL
jgi:hypothetical protein